MEDQSHENVSYLIEKLIDFRQEAPFEISEIYARINKELLKCFEEMNITLQIDECNCNVPDNPFEHMNSKYMHLPDEKLTEKIYELIQLLNILNKKKNCIISNIIEEI